MRADPDIVIEPRRGKREKLLHKRALMVVNPSEADGAAKIFSSFLGETRSLYQSKLLVDKNKRLCLAGPALGAPAAALLMEKFIVLGVQEIWLLSCCGSLAPSLLIGDLLLGSSAVSGEGVSQYYSSDIISKPSVSVTSSLQLFMKKQAIAAASGVIWSTDAPYREMRSKLIDLQERYGVVAIDMEYSALCTVARFRGIAFGGLFVVSDEIWGSGWKPGFSKPIFKDRCREIMEKLISHGLQEE